MYKPIGKDPFVEAGIIKGFEPIQPFQPPIAYANIESTGFDWPSLHQLNEEMNPFPWQTGEEDNVRLSGNSIESEAIFYTGPPPSPPTHTPPEIPPLPDLVASIINSDNKLFFISHKIGQESAREWRLVRIAFSDSISLNPSSLQTGKFLVDFYIPHTSDARYNGINQRYWLQYHSRSDISNPHRESSTHLIRPSDTSEDFAARHQLVPFRQWINLTHQDTYIHGPFNFATVNGRRTRDRISEEDWKILGPRLTFIYVYEPNSKIIYTIILCARR